MATSDLQPHPRDQPGIPDYLLLKKIGQGAYGEVWLSRSLTGAFRAIKIVRREKFDSEESFELEFHGIRQYEKVSRSHPALLDVLHVGRLRAPELYYYVMELGDSADTDAPLASDWETYMPKTLALVLKNHQPLPPRESVKIGLRLTEALEALHQAELIHRDIKPSNIVFVSNRPKLADLGLVAADGQRTCVGTLGYLAPEGPGSPLADIYSLGKVLYEMNTGRDRLDFPAMPEDFSIIPDKPIWRGMNTLVCRACSPEPRQRQKSAEVLGAELQALSAGKENRRMSKAAGLVMLGGLVVVLASVALRWGLFRTGDEPVEIPPKTHQNAPKIPPVAAQSGTVKVVSDPPGAQVFRGEELLGSTPLVLPEVPTGLVELDLVKSGFRTVKLQGQVDGDRQILLGGEMSVWRPPVAGELWENALGMRFSPAGPAHLSVEPVPPMAWQKILGRRKPADGSAEVQATLTEAKQFCKILTEQEHASGYLAATQQYRPARPADFVKANLSIPKDPLTGTIEVGALYLVAEQLPHGVLHLTSEPNGAEVLIAGETLGLTPLNLDDFPAGPLEVRLVKTGYEPIILRNTLKSDAILDLHVQLVRSRILVFGEPWENDLGMRFVPLGENLMISGWETRVRDYAAFVEANSTREAPVTDFPQTPNDPVVLVDRDDAVAFCQWLTERDRAGGFLPPSAIYRLPTDAEWSLAAGLVEEAGHSPASRDGSIKSVFPWGTQWPPPKNAGNFFDANRGADQRKLHGIHGYIDGYPQSAPVGSFASNTLGIYDLAGNVWEWVADDYGGGGTFGTWAVVRGGSWANEQRELLWTSYRNLVKPSMREPIFGFRVVIGVDAP